jgi:hypothetical protein
MFRYPFEGKFDPRRLHHSENGRGAETLSLPSGHESHILKNGIEGSNLQDIRWLLPCPLRRLCHNRILSLRATEGSVAISLISNSYKIASVVSLPRNDITTQSPKEEGRVGGGKGYQK